MTLPEQAAWDREAAKWAELQPIYPLHLKANLEGVWYDKPITLNGKREYTTGFLNWVDVQAELVDAETDDGR
jgi:hypothetical protein